MSNFANSAFGAGHDHNFLGAAHDDNERRTWMVIALLIGYEAVSRFLSPVPIHFGQAIPIAILGLLVNLASVWLLSGDHHQGT